MVRRIEQVPDGAVALFTFETETKVGALATGTGVFDLKREGLHWVSTGGSTNVAPAAGALLGLGYMGTGGDGANPYRTTGGL